MWSSKLFWKLFAGYLLLSFVLVGLLLSAIHRGQKRFLYDQVERQLFQAATILRSQLDRELPSAFSSSIDETRSAELARLVRQFAEEVQLRVTLADANGEILAESERESTTMFNHANRPEFVLATKEGRGTAVRRSPTLDVDMFYLALPVESDNRLAGFVRVAIPIQSIEQMTLGSWRYLFAFGIPFGTCLAALTYVIIGRIIQPLAVLTERAQELSGSSTSTLKQGSNADEIGKLASAFKRMQSELAIRFEQLRESNQHLSTVLGNLREGIIAVDSNEIIVLANEASRRMLDIADENPVGRHLLEAARCRPLHDAVTECLETGVTIKTDFVSSGKIRRELAVRATSLPGNIPKGVVVVLHDMSEVRRLESLRHEFVANVSHELKTPLASIKAYAETLTAGAIHEEQINLQFVARIEEQAERLHQLIIDMLHIARVESGEEAFDIAQVSLASVVESSLQQYSQEAEQKKIQVNLVPCTGRAIVLADEEGLRTIVDNLLSNALRYTPEGGVVTIRWRIENALGILEVEDTGIGIAYEFQSRIFERFYRVDKARTRELGGTGLGLSIVKHLCQAFGGGVQLRSALGQGSTFTVTLRAFQGETKQNLGLSGSS